MASEVLAADRFVGREHELGALKSQYVAASSGNGRLVLVSGESGIGKTRLALELSRSPFLREPSILWAHCSDGDGTPAFWPWLSMFRRGQKHLRTRDLPLATANLAELITALSLGSATQVPPLQLADPQHARMVLFEQAGDLLCARANAKPLLIVLDDAQWADIASLKLLEHLASRLQGAPILVCVLFRDTEASEREHVRECIANLAHHPWTSSLPLRGLSSLDSITFLNNTLAADTSLELRAAISDKARGNPFFLKELAQLVTVSDGTAVPSLPVTASAALEYQLRSFDEDTRRVLEIAALIGSVFTTPPIAHVLRCTYSGIAPAIERALARQIIVAKSPQQYEFSHELLREWISSHIPLTQRFALHAKIAAALEATSTPGDFSSTSTIAHHHYAAGPEADGSKALAFSIAAGRCAMDTFAFEEAVAHHRRACELSAVAESEVQCEALLALGRAEASAGYSASSRRTFRRVAQLAVNLDNPRYLAQAAIGYKGLLSTFMPPDFEMVSLLREARHALPRRVDPLRAELAAALGSSLYFSDSSAEIQDCASEVRSIADAFDDARLDALAIETEMLSHWRPSAVSEFLASSTALELAGRRINDPLVVFRALIMQQSAVLTFGNIQDADVLLDRAIDVAQAAPHPLLVWQGTLLQSCRSQLRGDFDRSEDLSNSATEMGQRVHPESAVHLRLMQHFQIARLSGNLEGWDSTLSAAIETFPSVPGYRAAAALTHAHLGRPSLAKALLSYLEPFRASPPAPNCLSLLYYSMLAETAYLLHDTDWALALRHYLMPYEQQSIVGGWGVVVDGSVAYYLAYLAQVLDDPRQATEYYNLALRKNRGLAAPPLVARTQLQYAMFLTRYEPVGQSEFAQTLLRDSFDIYSALKLPLMAEQARCALQPLTPLGMQEPTISHHTATQNEPNVFRKEGDYWAISFDNVLVRVRHSLGMQYIATLIAAGGNEIHVLDLVSGDAEDREMLGAIASVAEEPVLDPQARSQYRQRLSELDQELELALDCNDSGRIELLRQEKHSIAAELAASYGLGRRPRTAPNVLERARIRVKNRLTSALTAIKKHHEPAWRHFEASLRTGRTCSYRPERATQWRP
jgi:tetratricopeptide (TPR) repeat protein